MSLKSPNLDDRTFDQLKADALRLVRQKDIGWTDLSPSDPGIVLLELFAHLTEVMLYRLNRLPEKAYVEFLRLLGVTLQPPAAAYVELTFSRARATAQPLPIPRGTRVTVGRVGGGAEPPVFVTAKAAEIPAGATEVTVGAYHCDEVEAELAGRGNGLGGQYVQLRRPPLIASTGDPADLIVAVELRPEELDERIPAREYAGKTYRIWQWRKESHFTNPGEDDHIYVVDRNSGLITFAPAVRMRQADDKLAETAEMLAAVPAVGREIRVWYRRGGGNAGNVAADRLTVLKDPIPGVSVTNRERATGGKPGETLENALLRGPQELHSLQRAVTAKDFELIARNHSGRAVERARAFTRAALWRHAPPGHVEVLLVPAIPEEELERVTLDMLQARETEAAREQIEKVLDERRPLGTTCVVSWTRYKKVQVNATVVVQPEEDLEAVQQRIVQRLNQTITPVTTPFNSTGWPFGQALRASHVYDIALAERGVRWVDRVRLLVAEVPEARVKGLGVDYFQPRTWYAGSDTTLFRSLNDGEGWEVIGRFDGPVTAVRAHKGRAGLIAVISQRMDMVGSQVHVSTDCGETWRASFPLAFTVNGLDWIMRDEVPVLFLATSRGLYEIAVEPGTAPIQVLVDPQLPQERGFYAVATHTDVRGVVTVAVAAESQDGIFLSVNGGLPGSFRKKGMNMPATEDTRVLEIQDEGVRAYLWAGTNALEGSNGTGCYRWELRGLQDPPEGWQSFGLAWQGGSCKGLAFHRNVVFAASHRTGVLKLDLGQEKPAWQAPLVTCGLPLRDPGRFHPVDAVAAAPDVTNSLVMAGGIEGVHRTSDSGVSYTASSTKEFIEKVTLPDTWLFVSDGHQVTVLREDEASPTASTTAAATQPG
ncbi:MAG: baseplate J/gp47 family protein [Anaerolineales bacterium]|nr:baseplate J/gp47 family protein [Anaerolineales bacterium]MCB8952995.1 baseplate J/gp47 family protein [Ardenticatenales bacterium]